MSDEAKPKTVHGGRLLALSAMIGGSVFFWDSPVLKPFKLLAVMGHESGHALAALLVGGSVERVSLSANEAGECLSRIPDGFFARVLMSSGGYVGASIAAVVLLLLTFRFNARRWMLGAACVWLATMGAFYARDAFTLAFCLVMAAAFGAGAKWLPRGAVGALNAFLATFQALYSAMDLKDDLWNTQVRAQSDAAILASGTPLPAVLWAAVWTVVSVAVLGWGMWTVVMEKAKPTLAGGVGERLDDELPPARDKAPPTSI